MSGYKWIFVIHGNRASLIYKNKKLENMKKIILGGIAAIVIAVLAVVNVNMNSQSENLLSDIALANVEALAQEINVPTGYVTLHLNCYNYTISGIYPTGQTYTSCSPGGYAGCTPTSCN
jgi:predicted small secreted protein